MFELPERFYKWEIALKTNHFEIIEYFFDIMRVLPLLVAAFLVNMIYVEDNVLQLEEWWFYNNTK